MPCTLSYLLECRDRGVWRPAPPMQSAQASPVSYAFYGLLFGVRNEEYTPIAARRGFPEDVSPEVKHAVSTFMNDDGREWLHCHSISYISWAEVDALNPQWPVLAFQHPELVWALHSGWQDIFQCLSYLARTHEDARMVVWFDG